MKLVRTVVAALAALFCAARVEAKPPLSAFGEAPSVRAAQLSPDGSRIAFIARVDDEDVLSVYSFSEKKVRPLIRLPDIRARSLRFVSDNYIVIVVSKTTRTYGFRGRYEYSAAFSYNLTTNKIVQLLKDTAHLFPAQTGLGQILAVDPDGLHVYMPAYMDRSAEEPSKDLLRVDLDRARGLVGGGKYGNSNTIDWILDANGKVIAREDFDEKAKLHTIFAFSGDGSRKIYSKQTPLPEIALSGVSRKTGDFIVLDNRDSDFISAYEMSRADGTISEPIAQRADADIDELVTDANRVVHGVRYSGMQPSYEMFDKELDADVKMAAGAAPTSSVYLDSWSTDWSKLLFYVSGGSKPERYILMDRKTRRLAAIMNLRPEIKPEDVGEVFTVEYKARDGLTIPALLTWPAGVAEDKRKNLPLVVMPHGGPEAYDQIGFDWLAQFIANEGYAVLQPNFRGSAGFGASFATAGWHQWGRKMQDDITDGVKAVSAMGWVDPSRVCIVGWSYGGYAALAGGALTPDLYKCVAAIAGVSDLNEMLSFERRTYGDRSRSFTYWKSVIGDPSKDHDEIDAVSPVRLAGNFKAPVLLIHGSDDTTVPLLQSDRMNKALTDKDKPVTYLKIKGDDHSLVENESRRQALMALGDFLARNLKPAN